MSLPNLSFIAAPQGPQTRLVNRPDRRHGIASAQFPMPLEAKLRRQRLPRARRAQRSMGLASRYPTCGQDAATVDTGGRACPGTGALEGLPTIDAMQAKSIATRDHLSAAVSGWASDSVGT